MDYIIYFAGLTAALLGGECSLLYRSGRSHTLVLILYKQWTVAETNSRGQQYANWRFYTNWSEEEHTHNAVVKAAR